MKHYIGILIGCLIAPTAWGQIDTVNPDFIKLRAVEEAVSNEFGVGPSKDIDAAVQSARAAWLNIPQKRAQAKADLKASLDAIERAKKASPKADLLPSLMVSHVVDNVGTAAEATKITGQIDKLTKADRYQEAREELRSLASEIQTLTVSVPMKTFPAQIAKAAQLLNENKPDLEVQSAILRALHSMVVSQRAISIPLVRAIALFGRVDTIFAVKGELLSSKEAVQVLLNEASAQLDLSEKLGYGVRSPEYVRMRAGIKKLSANLKTGSEVATNGSILGELSQDALILKTRSVKTTVAPASQKLGIAK